MINKTSRVNSNVEGADLRSEQEAALYAGSTNRSQNGLYPMESERAAEFVEASQGSRIEEFFPANSTAELSNFFTLATVEDSHPQWDSSDLGSILSHQLSTPMAFDFCATIKTWVTTEETRNWPGENGARPKSFNDLFSHLSPSIRLLNLTKQFAKANWEHPESLLPREVAVVLYYTSIAVAFVRKGEWITKLSTVDARSGFEWIQSQSWVDKSTKNICLEAVESLN